MVLSAAFEFSGKMNPAVKERESDNENLSKVDIYLMFTNTFQKLLAFKIN